MLAISRASRCPSRRFSSYGPANAFSIFTCWSRTIPISSANGSVSSSSFAAGSCVQTMGMTETLGRYAAQRLSPHRRRLTIGLSGGMNL